MLPNSRTMDELINELAKSHSMIEEENKMMSDSFVILDDDDAFDLLLEQRYDDYIGGKQKRAKYVKCGLVVGISGLGVGIPFGLPYGFIAGSISGLSVFIT